MLLFAHTGITFGVAVLLANLIPNSRFSRNEGCRAIPQREHHPGVTADSNHYHDKPSWFRSLTRYADPRVILVGSLLPDIIDKPLGFLSATFSNGRTVSHTLLFLVLLSLIGLYLYRVRGRGWLLVLSFGTLMHLILDQMWRTPATLLWPFAGISFERVSIDLTHVHWEPSMFYAPFLDPQVYIPEIVGAVILVWFAQSLVKGGKFCAFIKYGQVE